MSKVLFVYLYKMECCICENYGTDTLTITEMQMYFIGLKFGDLLCKNCKERCNICSSIVCCILYLCSIILFIFPNYALWCILFKYMISYVIRKCSTMCKYNNQLPLVYRWFYILIKNIQIILVFVGLKVCVENLIL